MYNAGLVAPSVYKLPGLVAPRPKGAPKSGAPLGLHAKLKYFPRSNSSLHVINLLGQDTSL